jgi:hypothetical protein
LWGNNTSCCHSIPYVTFFLCFSLFLLLRHVCFSVVVLIEVLLVIAGEFELIFATGFTTV